MSDKEEKSWKCSVRDGNFVEPCDTLASVTDNAYAAFSRAKGVTRWCYSNVNNGKPTRTFFGVKSKTYPNGFNFNFCPFCGTDISAPFMEKDDASLAKATKDPSNGCCGRSAISEQDRESGEAK